MEQVALLKCSNYEVDLIEKTVRQGFDLLGGEEFLRKLIPPGSAVLLKPNMLRSVPAGSIIITNYIFFEAVIRVVKDYAGRISFGDSPGFGGDSRKAAVKGGLMEVASRYGVTFNDFTEVVHQKLDDALLCHSWDVARAPYEADVLITLPRLKTHALTLLTAAVKNQFGCVPGMEKPAWHTRMSDVHNFAKMLLDLNRLIGTSFAIVDGITAMEGNGPGAGSPHQMDLILMGESVTAVDSVAARLIGYDNPLEVPFLKEAHDGHWGATLSEEIRVLGESIASMKANNFKLVKPKSGSKLLQMFASLARSAMVPNPMLNPAKCIGCRRCYEACPVKPQVISMNGEGKAARPSWNYKKCIRCFCCQELCPQGAIEVRYSGLGRLFNH
jgi:uncharacterized protein (DUF362 family)/ferredoxin-like protein FixX